MIVMIFVTPITFKTVQKFPTVSLDFTVNVNIIVMLKFTNLPRPWSKMLFSPVFPLFQTWHQFSLHKHCPNGETCSTSSSVVAEFSPNLVEAELDFRIPNSELHTP